MKIVTAPLRIYSNAMSHLFLIKAAAALAVAADPRWARSPYEIEMAPTAKK